MSKTTTKTETVTEEFDKDGNVTKRVTETTEETFEDTAPATPYIPYSPYLPTYPPNTGIVQTTCRCGTGQLCYKHIITINTAGTNTATVQIPTDKGPAIIKGSSDLLKGVRVVNYSDLPVAQDAVSESVGCCSGQEYCDSPGGCC